MNRKGIVGVTMPGFGTTDRTYNNAISLMESLGITIREISIAKAVTQHFEDIGHDASVHDVTYENSQARERTQILMDLANQMGGMVIGTGDLSELALGWATYNGDHMSMYGVNASIPKTLIRHLGELCGREWGRRAEPHHPARYHRYTYQSGADTCRREWQHQAEDRRSGGTIRVARFLPLLLPAFRLSVLPRSIMLGKEGIHRYKVKRVKISDNDPDSYDEETIKKWLKTFVRRFFNQQFKRSCLPDGPKVGSVSLSPRGDWRMPSRMPHPPSGCRRRKTCKISVKTVK